MTPVTPPAPEHLALLEEVLSHFPEYAGSPETLAAHLEARGDTARPDILRSRTARLFELVRLLYSGGASTRRRAPRRRPLAVYYGPGRLRELGRFDTVVVHPGQYRPDEIRELRAGGSRVLAYLSLGEDNGPDAPWQREDRNPAWDTQHVTLSHPGWRRHLRAQISGCLPEYQGFLLDTLDVVDVRPDARPEMVALLREVRRWTPGLYLLANRGFSLLPELGRLVDGVLIESFSTTWEDGYRRLDPAGLAFTAAMHRRVQQAGLEAYALDYATTPALARFARQRAARLHVPTFVSTRELHHV